MCLNVNLSIIPTRLNVDLTATLTRLNVNLLTISSHLNVVVKSYSGLLKLNITGIKDTINITTHKHDNLNIALNAISTKLNISCSILCSAHNKRHLYVIPNIIWLTPDTMGEEFNIYSNVVWKIE